jgi:hypothetical protein
MSQQLGPYEKRRQENQMREAMIPEGVVKALLARARMSDYEPAAKILDLEVAAEVWDWLVAGDKPFLPHVAQVYDDTRDAHIAALDAADAADAACEDVGS